MKKVLVSLFLALTGAAAQAADIVIVQQSCNVTYTQCHLTGDGGQLISVAPPTGLMMIDGVTYSNGAVVSSTQQEYTTNRHVFDLIVRYTPAADVSVTHTWARSGSGRGGYQVHTSYKYHSITVY